jgi:parallel beta-helix repeat protein
MTMKWNFRNIATTIGPGLLALLICTEARADTLINTCGYLIRAAGKYRLAADLGPCAGDGIDIRTSNVTLDLDGHAIIGAGNGNGAGIDVEIGGPQATGINIAGHGSIQKFAYGVLLLNVANSDVHDVSPGMNSDYGIYVTDGVNLKLQDNVLTHNGTYGLRFVNSSSSDVHDNHIAANGNSGSSDAGGLQIAGGTGNRVHDNTIDSNQPLGIVLFNTSNQQVEDNKVNGNYNSGIRIEAGSTGNVVANNVAEGNLGYDLQDDNIGCDNNRWLDNVFSTSNQGCIH